MTTNFFSIFFTHQFETCLKFEEERISFDFNNPGEETVSSVSGDAVTEHQEDAVWNDVVTQGNVQNSEPEQEILASDLLNMPDAPNPFLHEDLSEDGGMILGNVNFEEDDGLPWN